MLSKTHYISRKGMLLIFISLFSIQAFSQEYATIFVYRPKKFSSTGIDFKIYVNGLEIAQVANGGRLEYRYYKEGRTAIKVGVFSEYGLKGDNYDNNLILDVKKGQSYYFMGESKSFSPVSNEVGKAEYEKHANFKGQPNYIDDRPFDYSSLNKEKPAEAEIPKQETTAPAPVIVLASPKLTESDLHTPLESIKISGYVDSKSNVTSVKINAETVPSDENGNFSMLLKLKEGLNKVAIHVENENKQSSEKSFRIIRDADELAAGSQQEEEVTYRGSDPFKGTNVANVAKEIRAGKYYALFIGIDNYSGTWTPLKNAVNDGKAIEDLLQTQYRFDVVKSLYNSEATRVNIIDQLEWLVANTKENDNVFIYYSGHGEFKKELNKGYWVPFDAKTTSTSQFISNSEIQTFLAGIPSKHTLLVSDACFSGDIFRGTVTSIPFENSEKYYVKVYESKSRQAISSGGIEPVMDGGRDGHSVFAYYMIQALKGNAGKYFDATQLFNKIKIPVVNNSDQSPNFNPIKNTGDEGGNFIFIRK